jgi:uncharacterized protein (TIGR03382 family)
MLTFLLTACRPEDAAQVTSPVIYDEDDRIELYQETNAERRNMARDSVAALFFEGDLDKNGDVYTLPAITLNDYINFSEGAPLCADQRFRLQPAGSFCSGTLIDDDLVLTAGHCFEGMSCSDVQFVFDYHYESDGTLAEINEEDVYDCARVLVREQQENPPFLDYAIARLSRKVTGRTPARVDETDDAIALGTDITVMGFPSGLPLKIDSGGEVIASASNLTSFTGTPDTFAGNSGSGVFDDTGRVVGILVSGQEDYRRRVSENCTEVNELDPDLDEPVGETITYVSRAVEDLCLDTSTSRRLCGGEGGGGCSASATRGSTISVVALGLAFGFLLRRKRRV